MSFEVINAGETSLASCATELFVDSRLHCALGGRGMKLSQDGAARPESGVKLDIRASEGSMMGGMRLCKAAIPTW